MKKFLNKNAPNNILNYLDGKDGIDASFVAWYESDAVNSKNVVYSSVYKFIRVKPKIELWVYTKISDATNAIKKFIKMVRR